MIIPSYVSVTEETDTKVVLESKLDNTKIIIEGLNNVADFKKLQQGQKIDNQDVLCPMIEWGMYTDEAHFKKLAEKMRKKLDKRITLTIMPTLGCNFRCTYCYEDHTPRMIERETLDGVLKYLEKEVPTCSSLNVAWFGGEPLLALDYILEYTGKFQSLARECGKSFSSSMTTNGYLLTVDIFKQLLEVGLDHYQITLDGPEHDKKRVLADGSPTYQVILDNLKSFHELDPDQYKFTVLLRRNVLPNESFEWYDEIGPIFGPDSRFVSIIRKVFPTKRISLEETIRNEEHYKEHLRYAAKYFKSFDDIDTDNIPFSKVCYAALPKGFVILPDGSIQKCTTTDFKKDEGIVGHVTPQGFEIDLDKNRVWVEGVVDEKCLKCKQLLSCMNMMCPLKRLAPYSYGKHSCEDYLTGGTDNEN